MNDKDTIKAVAKIVTTYMPDMPGERRAEDAMDKIGLILRDNDTANPGKGKGVNTGYRVIDTEGGTHEYPNAYGISVERLDLYLNDENNKTIAIFHRWENVERIA